jgi:3-dehydroquinate dehydratase-1
MSMGGFGSVSRMVGGVFGSSVTFAVGKASSAPGQIPIEELRATLATVSRSVTGQ